MIKKKIKRIIKIIKSRIEGFLSRSFLIIILSISTCIIFGGVIFYKYILIPIEGNFKHQKDLIEIDIDSYLNVLDKWEDNKRRFKEADIKKFKNPFFPIQAKVNLPKDEIIIEEETIIEDNISLEDFEEILAQTIFDFYKIKGEEMPLIPERALIWEELGLGKAEDYRGTHFQNISLLGALKKIMENSQ